MISSKLVCQHHKEERKETWLKKSSLERKWEESRHESPSFDIRTHTRRHSPPPKPPSSDEKSIFLSDLSMWLWSIFFPMVSLFLSWNPLRGCICINRTENTLRNTQIHTHIENVLYIHSNIDTWLKKDGSDIKRKRIGLISHISNMLSTFFKAELMINFVIFDLVNFDETLQMFNFNINLFKCLKKPRGPTISPNIRNNFTYTIIWTMPRALG